MKQISTGAGLVALSVGMVATAFIATHRSGSDAFAQGTAGRNWSLVHADQTLNRRPVLPRAESRLTDSCREVEGVNWFDLTPHPFEQCLYNGSSVPTVGEGSADLNADGEFEYFTPIYYAPCVQEGSPVTSGWFVAQQVTLNEGDSVSFLLRPALSFDGRLGLDYLGRYPSSTDAVTYFWGFRDMDGDGDLDAVVAVFPAFGGEGGTQFYWFKNIGFPKAPPAGSFDLDGDGRVDYGDIAILLMEFTG